MYLNMGENMVANGEHEKISIGRVLVSVSTPRFEGMSLQQVWASEWQERVVTGFEAPSFFVGPVHSDVKRFKPHNRRVDCTCHSVRISVVGARIVSYF